MTDNTANTKLESGNSKLDSPRTASGDPNFGLRVSADSPHDAKLETGNRKLDSAFAALRGSETLDSGLGTRDSQSKLLPFVPEPSTPRTPIQASAFPNPEPRVPSRASRVSALSLAHLTRQQLQFLLRVAPAALTSERDFEIPASVTLAQAILESATPAGWGSSTLFRLANNPFGIKYSHLSTTVRSGIVEKVEKVKEVENAGVPAHVSSSSSLTHSTSSTSLTPPDPYGAFDAATWEIENGQKKVVSAEFQRFPNLDEAFRAHALLLRSPRYRPAFAVRGDWKRFAERLGPKISPLDREHCGYSTSPSYSAELVRLVTLCRLDDPRAAEWYATGNDPGPEYGLWDTGHGPQGQVVAAPGG